MNNDGNNEDGNRMTWIGKWNDVNGKKITCMVTRQWKQRWKWWWDIKNKTLGWGTIRMAIGWNNYSKKWHKWQHRTTCNKGGVDKDAKGLLSYKEGTWKHLVKG
jgi:hypothetical protein